MYNTTLRYMTSNPGKSRDANASKKELFTILSRMQENVERDKVPTGVSCDESGGGCHPDLGPDHGRMSGDIRGW